MPDLLREIMFYLTAYGLLAVCSTIALVAAALVADLFVAVFRFIFKESPCTESTHG